MIRRMSDRRRSVSYPRIIAVAAVVAFLGMASAFAQVSIFGGLEYERFNRDLSPWKLATFELTGKSERGTITGRVTEARRFDTNGTQVEVEAYPRFGKTTYAYLNAGGSNSTILAHRRYAAELFHTLPGAWELSAGARRIEFTSDRRRSTRHRWVVTGGTTGRRSGRT